MEHQENYFEGLENHMIYYQSYIPAKPIGIVQISHGAFEHSRRYKYVIDELVSKSFIVYVSDHRGCGKSEGKRNHIKSFDDLVIDLYTLSRMIKEKHGDLPLFLIGHSMGSLVAQRYAIKHEDELKGLVLSGTGTINTPLPKLLELFVRAMVKIIPTLMGPSGINPDDISSNPESVEDYMNDPLIDYKKASLAVGYCFLKHYSEVKEKIPNIKIPVLLQCGSDDALMVGKDELFEDLKTKDKTMKIYEGLRHEVYQETREKREKVFADLTNWLNTHI